MSFDMKQFLQVFFEESFEGLRTMETNLLSLREGEPDTETINTIFRAAHSIKGGSGTFGLSAVSDFTHGVETLLDNMRSGHQPVTPEIVDVLLGTVDCLQEMLSALQSGADLNQDKISQMRNAVDRLLGKAIAEVNADQARPAQSSAPPAASGWRIRFRPLPHFFKTGNEPLRLFRELAALGPLVAEADLSRVPALVDMEPEESYLGWTLTLSAPVPKATLDELFAWVEGDCELEVTSLVGGSQQVDTRVEAVPPTPIHSAVASAPQTKAQPGASAERKRADAGPTRGTPAGASDAGSIRVAIDKIDALINMVGELVITQSMLHQLGTEFDIGKLGKLQEGLAQLERNTRELQENVMRIRMLPISFVFNRFPRLVHDLSAKFGKKIELQVSGENTELDKTVLEKIGDPLVHLVRNALDHGIESPETRRAAGKPETGVLHLNAYHQGGNIIIEISDDGAGIDKDKVLKKAREKGLVGPAEELEDEKIYDLIFQAGFSTADKVSDVSGRGVGMDVVKRNVLDLGGSVEIRSQKGKGAVFTIRLPLTLAILDGQLARVGTQIYILPLVSIVESLQIRRENLNVIAGRAEVYKLRHEYIPIVRLYELFNVAPSSQDLEGRLLVIVEGDGQRIGLFVDDLLGQQQVVIKSLETNYGRVEGISGATILGDGTVALILDVSGIIQCSRSRGVVPVKARTKVGQQTVAA